MRLVFEIDEPLDLSCPADRNERHRTPLQVYPKVKTKGRNRKDSEIVNCGVVDEGGCLVKKRFEVLKMKKSACA